MILSSALGIPLLVTFGAIMLCVTIVGSRAPMWSNTTSGFLYAGRNVGTVAAGFSIAASWLWAPALFVSVQKSYEFGLAGLFWFTVPNVLAVALFAILGPAIRKRVPGGFSLPDWIRHRFQNERPSLVRLLHRLYLIPFFWYQIMAVTVQIFVGGLLLNYLTAMQLEATMALLLVIVLGYALLSGLRASIITDVLHLAAILAALVVVIPWFVHQAGLSTIAAGFSGTSGSVNVLDRRIAVSFGIVTSIGLFSGSLADQQFWQRVFAIRPGSITRAFVLGGLLFGVVPAGLSVLGFAAAAPSGHLAPPQGTELPLIGIVSVVHFLPSWVAVVFVSMLLCALTSVVDSGLAAAASLYAIDVRDSGHASRAQLLQDRNCGARSTARAPQELQVVRDARVAMVAVSIISYGLALLVKNVFPLDRLWWLLNGVAAMFVVPTVLSVLWSRLRPQAIIVSILSAMGFMVVFVYGNYLEDDALVIGSIVAMLLAELLCCVGVSLCLPRPTQDVNSGAYSDLL